MSRFCRRCGGCGRTPSISSRGGPWGRKCSSGSRSPNEKTFNLKLSGDGVFYTNSSILLVKIVLQSKLHCQKVLNWKYFHMSQVRPMGSEVLEWLQVYRPGGNPGANRCFFNSTPTQMLPPGGSICGRLTEDLPLGCLQGGSAPPWRTHAAAVVG